MIRKTDTRFTRHAGRESSALGFTLIEVIVVVAVISLLMSLLLPALGAVRRTAQQTECLSNLRQIGVAHQMYMNLNREAFVDVDLPHGGIGDPRNSWLTKLPRVFHDSTLALRSPADRSPYWSVDEGGAWDGMTLDQALDFLEANPGETLQSSQISRWSSYGINYLLTRKFGAYVQFQNGQVKTSEFHRLQWIPRPSQTVHFTVMSQGEGHKNSDPLFARSDHFHSDEWFDYPNQEQLPDWVVREIEIGIHGGPTAGWNSRSNYLFVDGRTASLTFREVYVDKNRNAFLPLASPP